MNLSEIKEAVRKLDLTQADLTNLADYVHETKQAMAKAALKVGDEVVVVQKTKRTPGTVVKLNPSRAQVRMEGGRPCNVPYSMIELVG